jgi:hypothetical protein
MRNRTGGGEGRNSAAIDACDATSLLALALRGALAARNFGARTLRRKALTELGIGGLLDLACTELATRPRGKRPTRLIVHPSVYRCVADAHRHQTDRHLPLMLLGLELQQSDLTPPNGFRIAD